MTKRSYLFFLLWGTMLWCAGIFWAVWRWVPRVRVFPPTRVRWTFGARLVRESETYCPLDPALHDCNLTLEGSCPADTTRSVVHGVKGTIGFVTFAWPRDCA